MNTYFGALRVTFGALRSRTGSSLLVLLYYDDTCPVTEYIDAYPRSTGSAPVNDQSGGTQRVLAQVSNLVAA